MGCTSLSKQRRNTYSSWTEEKLGFSFTNPFAKHKQNLVDKYVSQGYSESASQAKAKQRIKTELVVGAVATVAVAAIAKKAATQIGQDYVDKTIKAGKTIQNIGMNPDVSFKDDVKNIFTYTVPADTSKAVKLMDTNPKKAYDLFNQTLVTEPIREKA